VCFEYGIVPVQYFLDEMPLWDLNDILYGISYKGRQEWERIRTLGYITIAPHCKKLDIKKMLPFPWDKDTEVEDTSISDKDIARLKTLAKQFEKGQN
jgi:hypothetical protein